MSGKNLGPEIWAKMLFSCAIFFPLDQIGTLIGGRASQIAGFLNQLYLENKNDEKA